MRNSARIVVMVALFMLPIAGATQEEPTVADMTSETPSAERLIKALTPDEGPPPDLQTMGLTSRGIGVVEQPRCEYYREAQTRGIAIQPVAEIVAMEVLFAFDSAELSQEASQTLENLALALASGELELCCFLIEGHTDGVGSDAYNLDLLTQRAKTVASYLSERGGVQMGRLLTAGRGESRPIADNATEQGRKKYRRVQVVNLGYFKANAL